MTAAVCTTGAEPAGPTGVVIATRGSRADVTTSRRGACVGCSEASACDLGVHEGRADVVTVDNRVGARTGDRVELDLPGNATLKLSALVWVAPLLGLVAGAAAGAALASRFGGSEDVAALLGSGAGIAAVFVGLRRIDRRVAGDDSIIPFIVRVVR